MVTSRKRVNESKVYSEENEWNPFPGKVHIYAE